MKRIILLLGIFLMASILFACAPKVVPGEKPVSPESIIKEAEATGKEPWQVEWEKTLAEARKEGKVVIYSGGGVAELRDPFNKTMWEKYGLKVDMLSGRAAEITQKFFSERKAGLYLADVYLGGGGSIINDLIPEGVLDPFPKIFLPEIADTKFWWNDQITFVDKGGKALAVIAYPQPPFAVNTNIVRGGEINSYQDLLHDKWKGKIIINDPTTPGVAQFWYGSASNRVGVDYMKQLANMNPVITRDQRLQVEWLAHGKFPIAVAAQTSTVTLLKKAGAPIDQLVPREGTHVTSASGNIALINKAPHPNAARLFINWLLTREGQTIYSQTTGHQSARNDVPTAHLEQDLVRQPGIEYFSVIEEDFIKSLPEHARVAREIFGPLMK